MRLEEAKKEELKNIVSPIQEVETVNDVKLGLDLDYPNKETPDCGKTPKRRGRKSLNELREMAEAADD
ncbi:hypothetical protein SUGI_1133130 [Cryptomeria japonica]|nr:hypothetical protein SUGI_1133130 [Cryptomeria japonica]